MEAFGGCSNLTEISLPEELEEIGPVAFSNCIRLARITLPEGLKKLGLGAFGHCKALREITVPEGVAQLEHELFNECAALERVRLPSHLTQLPEHLLLRCEALADLQADGVPLAGLPDSLCKRAAAVNFARRTVEGETFPEDRRAEFIKYIRSQKKKLAPLATNHPELRQFMAAEHIEIPE